MGGVASGTLRMARAITARSCVATLALIRALIVAAACAVLGADRLDRDTRAGRTPMTMAAITASAATFVAFTTSGRRKLERLERLDRCDEAFGQ